MIKKNMQRGSINQCDFEQNQLTDLMNRYQLFGLPIYSFEYHETVFNLPTKNQVKYQLNIGTINFNFEPISLRNQFIQYDINVIHQYNVSKTEIMGTNFECCNVSRNYFSKNSLSDLDFFIKTTFNQPVSIDSIPQFISIWDKLCENIAQHIEKSTKITKTLCQIISEYAYDSHLESYAIQKDIDMKIYLYMNNAFRTWGGMGCIEEDYCEHKKLT